MKKNKMFTALAAVSLAAVMPACPTFAGETEAAPFPLNLSGYSAETETETHQSPADTDGCEHLISSWYASMLAENDNFMFSPYSLLDCMRILYPAASGETRAQMEDVLGLNEQRAEELAALDMSMVFKNGIGAKSANRAYINTGLFDDGALHPEVLDTDDVDLSAFDDHTYEKINEYVSESTEQKITDLLTDSDVTPDTASVLLNCLYFNNTWNHEENTLLWENDKEVRSFSDSAQLYNIKEADGLDVLRIPYLNAPAEESEWGLEYGDPIDCMHNYALYVICDSSDSEDESVDNFMKNVTAAQLSELTDFNTYDGLEGYTDADFNVPQFEIRSRASLSRLLTGLGMTAPFDASAADFESFGPVFISDVMQEAYMKTTESGTEAAAATAMIMEATSALDDGPRIWKHVVADSPFAVILRDDTAGELLFVGRIGEPQIE